MTGPYRAVTLDESTHLLNMSYRLRYQSFCLERLFFSKDDYPTQLESDAFDGVSVHVGVLNPYDELVGTARIVKPTSAGLPLLRHCTLFPEDTTLIDPANTVVELSRVCVQHRSHRTPASLPGHDGAAAGLPMPAPARAMGPASNDVFGALVTGVYQATKRMRVTHWIVAIERALWRRVSRYGLPFRPAGPESDYFGPVVPYVLDLAELDDMISSGRYPMLADLRVGLEREYWAAPAPVRRLLSRQPAMVS
jgi:N-acyl amino acid synthase of PEP-CTERM/exosortase system